jgi:hypothetical protein
MKKFGILCLALVIALGALGVGYAAWTDTITIHGTVGTGTLCFGFDPGRISEVGGCPDKNFDSWVWDGYSVSCPMGYHFEGIADAPEDKCPATVSFDPVDEDGDGYADILYVTINDAYPYFCADISFWVCNCGTIPLKIEAPVITQSPFLLIEYGDNIGKQLHPGQCVEISFYVGVTQHEGYEDAASGLWIIDDETKPLCPQGSPLTFAIDIGAIQWNEYTP